MRYAAKLDIRFPLTKIKTKTLATHGYHKDSNAPLYIRKYVTKNDIFEIRDLLPDDLCREIVSINICDLMPIGIHTHTVEKSIINFYISVNNESTVFYHPKKGYNSEDIINYQKDQWVDNNTTYLEIIPELVEEAERYVANKGDCWLLDVTAPHSVETNGIIKNHRSILQIYLNTPYQRSLEILDDFLVKNHCD